MTSEQATDKVYAATGVLLGTDKAPHIASYMAVMEARIAELEAALWRIVGTLDDPTGGQHVADMRKASFIAIAALAGGKDE